MVAHRERAFDADLARQVRERFDAEPAQLPARPGRRGGAHGPGDLRGAGEEADACWTPCAAASSPSTWLAHRRCCSRLGGSAWHDLIIVPLVASVTHQLVELLGAAYVETQREAGREPAADLMGDVTSPRPLDASGSRGARPATGGSAVCERTATGSSRPRNAAGGASS